MNNYTTANSTIVRTIPQQQQQQLQQQQSRPITRRQQRLELTEDQKAEIRESFEIFDMKKTGALDFHEFKVTLMAHFIGGSEGIGI